MLLRPPSSAKQKKVRIVAIATASCSAGAIALLRAGVDDLTFLALAGGVIGNVGLAYIGWPASDGLPAGVRHGRRRWRTRAGGRGRASLRRVGRWCCGRWRG